MMRQPTEREKHNGGIWETKRFEPLVLENPTSDKKLMLVISGDSKTVDWVNGHAKLKTPDGTVAAAQKLTWRWWSRSVDLWRRVADWAVHIFREQIKKPMFRLGKVPEAEKKSGLILRMWSGPKPPVHADCGMVAATVALAVPAY